MSREKRLQKKKKRLYYKVMHQKNKPNKFIYYNELFFAVILECFRRFFKFLFVLLSLALLIGIGVLFMYILPVYTEYRYDVDGILVKSSPDDFKISEGSIIYNKDGEVIANLYKNADLEYLSYDEIPDNVVNAFVAVEDRSFWENDGIDLEGIARVCLNYLKSSGEEVHGASTITQQLARNIYLTHEVSIERKAKEILLSLDLTKRYSKKEIMEFYVNNICFANGVYGIEGASKAYFNKGVDELSLSQIAYLCAIPNRPEYYNPYKNKDNALARRDKILRDMYEMDYITDIDLKWALDENIDIVKPSYEFNNYETTYAVDCAVKYLMKLNGFDFKYEFGTTDDYRKYHNNYNDVYNSMRDELYTGGYQVYTSLDSEVYKKLQGVLDETLSFSSELDEGTGVYALQGALTCVDNETQKVVALVGGRSQESESTIYSLNRAYQSYRQPGSSIKPLIVYTPALELGYNANTSVMDIDVTKAKEKGVDVQSLTGNKMTLRSAVENSRNGVAWKIFDKITPKAGLRYLVNMRFSNLCPDDYYNSASLGGFTHGVTTVEMASAYATLVNNGVFKEPTCLTSILDRDGKEVYKDDEGLEIYTSFASSQMRDILKGVLTKGTASKLRWSSSSDIEAFAKTGTTNNSKDGWLCGSTPDYSIAVWVGYDTPKTLSNLYGATYPGNIWKGSMLAMVENSDNKNFESVSGDITTVGQGGYYSYLEGRDDSEVLSSGYTVADYRSDRVIGESVTAIINKMYALDKSSSTYYSDLESLYTQGQVVVDTIYSVKYTSEMQVALNKAYDDLKNK